jgi:hypothetical protein
VFSLDLSYFSFVVHFPLVRSYSLDLGSFLLWESLVRMSWALTKFLIKFLQLVLLQDWIFISVLHSDIQFPCLEAAITNSFLAWLLRTPFSSIGQAHR